MERRGEERFGMGEREKKKWKERERMRHRRGEVQAFWGIGGWHNRLRSGLGIESVIFKCVH